VLPNPKQSIKQTSRDESLYPYYAGYSKEFVSAALKMSGSRPGDVVLDPWNGAGTTTAVCSELGIDSIGVDLNPAMVVVAKARVLQGAIEPSLGKLLGAIVYRADRSAIEIESDALLDFFDSESVSAIRRIKFGIDEVLVEGGPIDFRSSVDLGRLSPLAALYYALLFRAVRSSLHHVYTSNPTWTRRPRSGGVVGKVSYVDLVERLKFELSLVRSLPQFSRPRRPGVLNERLVLGDSRSLPLEDDSISSIVTSPPYCTRIDYAVATRVELAVLGVARGEDYDSLRRSLIGSTLTANQHDTESELPDGVRDLLARIGSHRSKASSTYYYRSFADYFCGMAKSISESGRVLRSGGYCSLVVQDSFYKDIHVDLVKHLSEIASGFGLNLTDRFDFPSKISMRTLNPHARANARSRPAIESVAVFRKS
jgi:SAM-dependent methyltransferase